MNKSRLLQKLCRDSSRKEGQWRSVRGVGGNVGRKLIVLVERQRFGEIVRQVQDTRNMLDAELALADAVPQPMKAHVYALRQFRGDGVMSESDGKFIVT